MKRIVGLSFGLALAAAGVAPVANAAPVGAALELREATALPLSEVASRRHVRRHRNGAAVAGALIGSAIIGGAIIANSQRRRYYDDGYYYGEPAYPQPYYQPQPYYYPQQPTYYYSNPRPRRDYYGDHRRPHYGRESPRQYWENRNEK